MGLEKDLIFPFGYVYDEETGLYYLQSRYYNPELGRFINADGLLSTGQGPLGYNMFAYCLNNPINYVDRTGALPWALIIIGVCAIGGLIYGLTTDRNLADAMRPKQEEKHDMILPPVPQQTPSGDVSLSDPNMLNTSDMIAPPDSSALMPSNDSQDLNTTNILTTKDRINNAIIGMSFGTLVGGTVVFLVVQ